MKFSRLLVYFAFIILEINANGSLSSGELQRFYESIVPNSILVSRTTGLKLFFAVDEVDHLMTERDVCADKISGARMAIPVSQADIDAILTLQAVDNRGFQLGMVKCKSQRYKWCSIYDDSPVGFLPSLTDGWKLPVNWDGREMCTHIYSGWNLVGLYNDFDCGMTYKGIKTT